MGDEPPRQIALYLDHDISWRLARQLRDRGYDAVGAWEAGNHELSDQAQLEYAANQGRVLVTCNAQDFVPLYQKWWDESRPHSGIVVSGQLAFGEMLRRLISLLKTVTIREMQNMIRNLSEFQAEET